MKSSGLQSIGLFLLALFLHAAHLHADEVDVTQPLRISQLMPREGLFSTLAVEPAIPNDFIALSKEGEIVYSDWVYWGPKEILKAYFQDPSSLSEPILRVKFTTDIKQRKYFSFDEKPLRDQVSSYLEKASFEFGRWGAYPYCRFSGWMDNSEGHLAYVGLNEDNGAVLLFHLIVPQKPESNAPALKLWKKFFQETKELPEPLFFKANGQELHIGYTIVDIVGRKIKVTAEKRKSDQKVQFTAIPQDQTVEFRFEKAFKTIMEVNWHHNKPLLKIKGTYIVDEGWVQYSMTTSVLIKEVDEFSSIPPKKNLFLHTL